jgi:pimeloyl-ACP methyl ester carboxylesterase
MARVESWSHLACYVWGNPKFWWGLFLDTLVLPLALLMFFLKWMDPLNLDRFYVRKPNRPSLLLIHGSGANEAQWLISYLYLKSKYNVYSVQLNRLPSNHEDSIEDLSLIVLRKLEEIQMENESEKVILVGHSMGGLVAAHCVEHHQPDGVQLVVTINTPFNGAPGLTFLNMGTVRHKQMTPQSEFLTQLNEKMKLTNHCYLCFGSSYDFQVPHAHAKPIHFNPSVGFFTHPFGHTSAILFPHIWNRVKQFV